MGGGNLEGLGVAKTTVTNILDSQQKAEKIGVRQGNIVREKLLNDTPWTWDSWAEGMPNNNGGKQNYIYGHQF